MNMIIKGCKDSNTKQNLTYGSWFTWFTHQVKSHWMPVFMLDFINGWESRVPRNHNYCYLCVLRFDHISKAYNSRTFFCFSYGWMYHAWPISSVHISISSWNLCYLVSIRLHILLIRWINWKVYSVSKKRMTRWVF